MENYDVIIIGGGLAGCSLAYHLHKDEPSIKVLILEKDHIGNNNANGCRNVTEDVVEEYSFPYLHRYQGVRIGIHGIDYFTLNKPFYLLDYETICNSLFSLSCADICVNEAIGINKHKVMTRSGNAYYSKYIIDCSGPGFFAKKFLRQKIPFRYFIGKTRVLNKTLEDKRYYHYQLSNSGYIEELYPINDISYHGDWQYTKDTDFSKIRPEKKNLFNRFFDKKDILSESFAVLPASPVLPLVHKNIAFLGNSFGNAMTSSGYGILPTLDSSKILTSAIINGNIQLYQNDWKNKYLDNYIKFLTLKFDGYHNNKILSRLKQSPSRENMLKTFKKYPEVFDSMLHNKTQDIPAEMKKIFPKRTFIFRVYYYLMLRLKYQFM